jgi:hypothetical protein
MLPGIKNTILDFAMGVQGAQADGRFAAIGVAEKFGQGILTFNAPDQVEPAIGDGPLRDLLVSALSIARTTVSVIAIEGSLPGTVTAVTSGAENQGTGSITVSGSPPNEYDISVAIEASGTINEAVFRLTVDGLPGRPITVPDGEAKYPEQDSLSSLFPAQVVLLKGIFSASKPLNPRRQTAISSPR